ncbi:MAG TPA: hypothetical protein PLU17_07175 [Chitinophagaceae bacterium]|nr:hypothetical protein [Chitinophagaceae bacterium]
MRFSTLIFCLFFSSIFSFGQNKHEFIQITPKADKQESIPFKISDIQFLIYNKDTLGKIASSLNDLSYSISLSKDFESELFIFTQNRFKSVNSEIEIILKIQALEISNANSSQFSPSDTFKFICIFCKKGEEQEYLYEFKARNSVGLFKNPNEIVENYIKRAVTSSIQQFTKSYLKNPTWQGQSDDKEIKIKSKVIHNQISEIDTIACEKKSKISLSDYKGKLSKDTLASDVISRLVLTYKAESVETSKGIELTIYTKAFFDKNRSWKKQEIENPNWLDYQQAHFDLCTIYGYKLKDSMSIHQYSIGEFKSELNGIFNKIYADYISMRKLMADETNEGKDSIKLLEWKRKMEDF